MSTFKPIISPNTCTLNQEFLDQFPKQYIGKGWHQSIIDGEGDWDLCLRWKITVDTPRFFDIFLWSGTTKIRYCNEAWQYVDISFRDMFKDWTQPTGNEITWFEEEYGTYLAGNDLLLKLGKLSEQLHHQDKTNNSFRVSKEPQGNTRGYLVQAP